MFEKKKKNNRLNKGTFFNPIVIPSEIHHRKYNFSLTKLSRININIKPFRDSNVVFFLKYKC